MTYAIVLFSYAMFTKVFITEKFVVIIHFLVMQQGQ